MRRFRRIIFNGLTVLSLVLCVATAMQWVQSFGRKNEFYLAGHGHSLGVSSSIGILELSWDRRYGLSGAYRLGAAPDTFEKASNGRLLDRHEPWNGGYLSQGSWSQSTSFLGRSSVVTRRFMLWDFAWHTFDGVTGNFVGATDWLRSYMIRLPHWPLVILLGAQPLTRAVGRWRRRRRRLLGLCSNCNYDLRATPNRCPECGMVPKGANA